MATPPDGRHPPPGYEPPSSARPEKRGIYDENAVTLDGRAVEGGEFAVVTPNARARGDSERAVPIRAAAEVPLLDRDDTTEDWEQ